MRLSAAFAKEGDTLKAIEVLDLSLEKMPIADFDHYSLSMEYPEMYYKLGEVKKAREDAAAMRQTIIEEVATSREKAALEISSSPTMAGTPASPPSLIDCTKGISPRNARSYSVAKFCPPCLPNK